MNALVADEMLNDPLVRKAKEELLAAIETHRKKITGIRPPLAHLKLSYAEAVKNLGNLRGQDPFYPYIGSGLGNGALVELADGSVKYDFISGIGCHWGHSHPKLIAASLDASLQDTCMEANLQSNRDASELMELLVKHSGMDHCFLTTSGAMANENALKMVFQKRAPSQRILAFERCFMGRTLALAQITDKPTFREGLPLNFQIDYVPFYDEKDPKGSTERALSTLKKHLTRYPDGHACMCFEMIQGEAGGYPGQRDFFLSLMRVLKENNIPIFVDEIQSFGRTDHLFAFQHFGLEEYVDVVSCGKLMQVCATLFKKSLRPKPMLIAQTFLSATSLIRVSKVIIKSILEEGYLGVEGKNMQIRKHFTGHLERLAAHYPDKFQGPFGYGLMIPCTPFKGDREKVIALAKALFEAGLITFLAGSNPTRLRFLVPPGGVTFDDLDHAASILEETLKKL